MARYQAVLKYLKFMASRGVGTLVDTLILWVCSHFIFGGGYAATYLLSPIISFEFAVMSNFLCSYFWIWSSRVSQKNMSSFWRHFVAFNLSSMAGFVVKMCFLLLFERIFGWHVVVCNLAALAISGVLNYFLSDAVVFRKISPRPAHELLSIEELADMSPIFRGTMGQLFGRFAMWVCGIGRLNRLYDSIYHHQGPDCATAALDHLGCDYLVGNPERLDSLPDGAFITISNHPYGAIDGVITLDMIGHRRGDLKIMVNQILARVEPMRENFIAVTPTGTERKQANATTLAGVRTSLAHLRSGHPMSFFPSGAVSDLHPLRGDISDRPWQEPLIRLIERAEVPIVPIRFVDRNSMFYYLLGLIDWRVRLLRLPYEVFNKGRGKHRVVIGRTIGVEEQRACGSIEALTQLLRKSVYEMPLPTEFTPASSLRKQTWTPQQIHTQSTE